MDIFAKRLTPVIAVRDGPARDATSRDSLFRGEIGRVEAVAANLLRIRLPNGKAGYVSLSRVRPTEKRLGATDSWKAPAGLQTRPGGAQ